MPKEIKIDDSVKRRFPFIGKFRRCWWFFTVFVAVIVLGLFRVATVRQDGESNLPAPSLAPLAQVPADEHDPQVNAPPVSEPKPSADHLELPSPEDVEALARYHGTSGRKNIRDAEVFWQKGADTYIDFLRNETFEQGVYRTYITSELWSVTKPCEPTSPSHPDIIRYLARTRRLTNLVSQVIEARQQRNVIGYVETISQTVSRLILERRDVEQKVMNMMETEPDAFTARATRDQESRLAHLIPGVGSTGFVSAENAIPMSLQGAQLGVVANTFLLGLTEYPDAVEPIMDTLHYDDRPIIDALCACEAYSDQPAEKQVMKADLVFVNRAVVADALDRILVACADNDSISQEALSLAGQYKQWRDSQDLPDREIQNTFTYDSPQTPYHLPGRITGAKKEAVETYPVELPLMLWESLDWNLPVAYRLKEDTIQEIIDWAERFNAAAH